MDSYNHPARGEPRQLTACRTCGGEVASSARFCASCGTAIEHVQAEVAPDRVQRLLAAQRLIDLGDLASSISMLEALRAEASDWASARIALAIAYVRAARVDDARDELEAAEATAPGSFQCELAWAEYQARLGFYDRAVTRLDRALALDPPSLQAHTAATELRRVCRERAKHLYYRHATLPRWMARFQRDRAEAR
jgi:tetratricopeptide (TPR) repeat protein